MAACVMVAGTLGGCAGPSRVMSQARVYPVQTPRSDVLDVQAVRDGVMLRMTNTSVRRFGPSVVWVNMAYGRAIDGWAPGERLELDLREFRDEFGEAFRGGGFFARERPDDVVLVQVQTQGSEGNELVGLVTVDGKVQR